MMFRLALSAFALATAVPATAQGPLLTPAEFRDRIAAAMAASTGNSATIVDDSTFSTQDAGGEEVMVSTSNAYADYRSQPENLTEIVTRFASVLGAAPTAAKPDQLVLIVRPANYVQQTLPDGGSPDKFPAPRPLAGDLAYFLAIDSPDSIRIASDEDLKDWGLDEQMAWSLAQSNLKVHMGPVAFAGLEGEPGARLIVADSGLAPSLLSDPALCGPESADGLLALVIERGTVLVAFPDDKASIRAFWKAAKPLIERNQGLSTTPIICSGGHWAIAPTPR